MKEAEEIKILYAARFRRDLNSVMRALKRTKDPLERVVVKSRRTGTTVLFAISARAYEMLRTGK